MLLLRRFIAPLRIAAREEGFLPVLRAAGLLLALGTATYALGNGWSVVDALYFAAATATTSSIQDPDLVLEDDWLKVFTVLYVLLSVGILVELARRLGMGFVAHRERLRHARHDRHAGAAEDPQDAA